MLLPKRRLISEEELTKMRHSAIDKQIKGRGIEDEQILSIMREIPRHEFLPVSITPAMAYADRPLPIGCNQTVSQPYIVAYMIKQLDLSGRETVLEIGTGCGYQAAILSKLCKEVVSLEIVPELAQFARKNLDKLTLSNVEIHTADGFNGWMQGAPYDRIISSCAMPHLPKALLNQLCVPGKLIAPVGPKTKQNLILLTKTLEHSNEPQFDEYKLIPVNFVPMRGIIDFE